MIKNINKFNLIHNTHLPWLTVSEGVIRKLLKEDDNFSTELVVIRDGDIDSASI